MSLKVRPGILDIAAYVPGDHSLPGEGPVYRMASNESALGPSPKAIEAYRALAGELHRYPDGASKALRAALGRTYGIDAATGSSAAPARTSCCRLLVRAYAGPGDEVLYTPARLSGVPDRAPRRWARRRWRRRRTDLRTDVDALLKARDAAHPHRASSPIPNNPTGSYVCRPTRWSGCTPACRATCCWWSTRPMPNMSTAGLRVRPRAWSKAHDNVVMTRTFSKIFGLAALRLGWAYCPPAVADVLNRIRGPFNVPAPAQAAGVAALADREHLARPRRTTTAGCPGSRSACARSACTPIPASPTSCW